MTPGKVRLEESSKLEFYSKNSMNLKKGCGGVKDKKDKSDLTKLRVIAHNFYIDTGRYDKYDKVSKTYIKTPKELVHYVPIKWKVNIIFYLNVDKIQPRDKNSLKASKVNVVV